MTKNISQSNKKERIAMYATEKAVGIFVMSMAIVYICKKDSQSFFD